MAGKVRIEKQGLYCRIICRCQVPSDRVFRLYVVGDNHRENLGVVIPEGDGSVLRKTVSAKHLGKGPHRFVLSSGTPGEGGIFVPICPEEPFAYIDRLKTAFLTSRQGKIGITITESPEAQ